MSGAIASESTQILRPACHKRDQTAAIGLASRYADGPRAELSVQPLSGVAKPLGDLGGLFRPPPEDFFVALGDERPACRARDGVAVSLEPSLVSVEFMPAMRADEVQRGGGLIGYRPYSWHWLTPKDDPHWGAAREAAVCL
jgi:hypothetical protein